MLKSTGAFDNPFKTYATCAWNLPWVQESGQNLCNCCMVGWTTSQRVSFGWMYSEIMKKAKLVDLKMKCSKYKIEGECILVESVWKKSQLSALFQRSCPKNAITGKTTAAGQVMHAALQCISSQPKMRAGLMTALVFVFKGFLCRFQNIGLNPKVMMQLSPLPPISLFRRRRAGGDGLTPGMSKCKEYLKGGRRRKSKDKSKGGDEAKDAEKKDGEKEGNAKKKDGEKEGRKGKLEKK